MSSEISKIRLAYKNMLDRCYNPSNASYKHYGNRGIEVCSEWLSSRDCFIEWSLGNGHRMDYSLDRIDNSKGYSPDNCRWADIKTQLRNQRRNRLISYNNETKTITEWAEILGIGQDTLHRRISVYKMPLEKAMTAGRLVQWKHGTRQGYEKYKCKCDLCKESNNKRHRDRRAKKKL